jgi:lipopolysaccharide/colanic/teichoic acid biosynthesis glycosyltransferase
VGKRLLDVVIAVIGVIVLAVPMVLIGAWIKFDSAGSIFFRQIRVGRYGHEFRIFKFRTMRGTIPNAIPQLTIGDDPRITRVGAFLRRYKIDELPQLFNVLCGHMSLVGPRPEVPFYVAYYPTEMRDVVLSVRPGITDLASVYFRNESELLSQSSEPEKTYIEEVLPVKLRFYAEYVRRRNLLLDMKIAFRTLQAVFFGNP